MDFNLKSYRTLVLKKYFKTNNFFFLSHSAKLNLVEWRNTEQNLKKLKLEYYKPLNRTTGKAFKNSIYKNYSSSVGGFVLFINSRYKTNSLNLELMTKSLKPSFVLTGVKLTNKIYHTSQLKGIKDLSYKKTVFTFHRTLDKCLKKCYVLTTNNKNSK